MMTTTAISWAEQTPAMPSSPFLALLLDQHEFAAAERRRIAYEAWFQRKRARYLLAKRVMDIVLASCALLVLLPVFLAIVCLIKLDDGGPALYRRTLLGLHDVPFEMYKFRTMMVRADAYLREHPELLAEYAKDFKLRDDPRVTRVGGTLRKYSLDELPQLWNVIRGEMSLIGPRSIPPSELALCGEFASLRHTIRPGLTGLWQVSGRSNTTYQQRIRLDREYVLTCSLRRDLRILLRTLRVVTLCAGAY